MAIERNGPFHVVENTWITLADGARLATRLWLPDAAEVEPVPVVLEYLPYRKRDGTSLRDEVTHAHFAANGYACARVDLRGNGDSDGLMRDEYTRQELVDGFEVIEWLAAQPWCTGAVGIIGISWGGFNGLQIAALAPPSLKAVVTVCSTDDRYASDIHYMGGCLLNDNMTWSQQMLGYSSRPPDPQLVGERWREMWMERLENMPFLIANWLRHQTRDAFWQHGSVCEDYAAIQTPVLAVGGWADAYTSAVPRLLEGLTCPRKGLIGPWEHRYPNIAHIEPRIDFLAEALRWWDQWLKGLDTGVAEDPDLRVYLIDSMKPSERLGARPGRWVSEPVWPSPRIREHRLFLGAGTLSARPASEPCAVAVATPQHLGAACGAFCPGMRIDAELPGDQTADDALAVCFDSEPLAESLSILGAARLDLEFESDRPLALLAVRLCDVRGDGSVARIAWAPLNLTHRDGHQAPTALEPGRRQQVTLALEHTGYVVPAGHRLRLALSTSYWPMLWPSPTPATVTVHCASSHLRLPLREGEESGPELPATPRPVPPDRVVLRAESSHGVVGETAADGTVVSETEDDFGLVRHPGTGLEYGACVRQRFAIHPDDPLSALAEAEWHHELGRDGWRTRTESRTRMSADQEYFHVEASLVAYEDDVPVFDRTWRERIRRDLV